MTLYRGSCHCGHIAYTVEGEIDQVISCNCSICRRRGHLLWFVPGERLQLQTPERDIADYQFNRKIIHHHFCPNCGCGPFGRGVDRDGKPMAAINVRCLEDVDLNGLKVVPYDGINH